MSFGLFIYMSTYRHSADLTTKFTIYPAYG